MLRFTDFLTQSKKQRTNMSDKKQHDLTNHSTQSLIVLYNDKKTTLNNPVCEPIHGNIQELLKQITNELKTRSHE